MPFARACPSTARREGHDAVPSPGVVTTLTDVAGKEQGKLVLWGRSSPNAPASEQAAGVQALIAALPLAEGGVELHLTD